MRKMGATPIAIYLVLGPASTEHIDDEPAEVGATIFNLYERRKVASLCSAPDGF
jgi:hypothetical protein